MERRALLKAALALGLIGPGGALGASRSSGQGARPAAELPPLEGDLTVYLGRGEGGLYGDILDAIRERNPDLGLSVRRGPAAALANTIAAEADAGVSRADVFWSIDSGSLGVVADQGAAREIPGALAGHIHEPFRYPHWAAISGRVRTVPYNTGRVERSRIPRGIMDFPDSDLRIGWAPSYGSFQSFVTAMRILEGEARTRDWLRGVKDRAQRYAGELGVVMAVARGEVDVGLANHYYTLRYKRGKPEAPLELAFTQGDAGSLVNVSGAMLLGGGDLAEHFLGYLLSREVQGYLAREAFEIPMAPGVSGPEGMPSLTGIQPPDLDLTRLGDLQPTLALMREEGVL